MPVLKVKLLAPGAKAPTVAHPGEDLGYDLYTSETVTFLPRGSALVPTGIAVQITDAHGKPMGALLRDKTHGIQAADRDRRRDRCRLSRRDQSRDGESRRS